MENQKEFASNFVSAGALALLLVLTVLASYYQMGSLPAFLLLVFLLAFLSRIWGKHSLHRLEISLEGKGCHGFPGETMEFFLTADNDKLLPVIWLDVALPDPPRECVALEGGFRRKFAWLMPRQTLRWHCQLEARKRGVFRVCQVEIASGDGFGLSVEYQTRVFQTPAFFVVYPRLVPVEVSCFLREYSELERGNQGMQEDVTLLKSSRAYQPGDSGKRINWRVLARQSELVVNIWETVQPRNACFLLDLLSFARWREEEQNGERVPVLAAFHEEQMEDMLSLTASCIVALSERQMLCGLVIPTIGKREGQLLLPSSLDAMVPELLTELAALEYAGEGCFLPQEAVQAAGQRMGRLYVVAECPGSLSCRPVLEGLEESKIRLLTASREGERPGVDYRLWEARELRRKSG